MAFDSGVDIVLYHLETVDSTNAYAKANIARLPDGTLVTAGCQTAGRGRMGRCWVSPAGRNFYGSLVMKRLERPLAGTMAISLGALLALRKLAPSLPVWLKWPNDLYVGEAKLAGVLSETVAMADGRRAVIAGIGVNLNLTAAELSAIDRPATSVLATAGVEINPDFFASVLAESVKSYYSIGIYSEVALFSQWRAANRIVGLEIELEVGGSVIRGVAAGIADDGALLIRDASGKEKPYYCGDATIRRTSLQNLAKILQNDNH